MQMRASSLPRQAGDGKAIRGSAFPSLRNSETGIWEICVT
jgi:hypothetical protein